MTEYQITRPTYRYSGYSEEANRNADYGLFPTADLHAKFRARRSHDENTWLAFRLRYAISTMGECVLIDPDIRGGVPVFVGTRMPVSRVVAEIASCKCITTIANNLEIDASTVRGFFECLAIHLDRPIGHVDELPSRRVCEQ